MTLARLTVVVIALAASGCGGSGESSDSVTSIKEAPKTVGYSRVGCDVSAECSTVSAEETLKRCPAERLDARGRKARRRLERLLARIERVDLHNQQVDAAYAAAMRALADLERECL